MGLLISQNIRNKLAGKTPPVTEEEIEQCFANRTGKFLVDIRAKHRTNPPTRWFVSETDHGRRLKVAFVPPGRDLAIKTAYDPNPDEIRIYKKYG